MKQLIAILFFFICCTTVKAQPETFDIVSYTPPQQWKKQIVDGVVNFTRLDEEKNTFCALFLYPAVASVGDEVRDFNNQWQKLAAEKYNAGPASSVEKGKGP